MLKMHVFFMYTQFGDLYIRHCVEGMLITPLFFEIFGVLF